MSKATVVIVHGVGDSARGGFLEEISVGLCAEKESRPPRLTRNGRVHNGTTYEHLDVAGHDHIREVYEINWSDVLRPRESLAGVTRHVLYLCLTLLQLTTSYAGPGGGQGWRRFWASWPFKLAFQVVVLWLTFFPGYVLLLAATSTPAGGAAVTLLSVLAVGLAGVWLGRVSSDDPGFYVGAALGGAAFLAAGLYRTAVLATASLKETREVDLWLGSCSGAVVSWLLLIATGLLLLVLLQEGIAFARDRASARLAVSRVMFHALPVLALSFFTVALLVLLLYAARGADPVTVEHLGQVTRRYRDALLYDLATSEIAITLGALLAAGAFAAAALLSRTGDAFRRRLGWLLGAMTLATLAFCLYFVSHSVLKWLGFDPHVNYPPWFDVITIYTLSAGRFLSALALLVPQVRTVLDKAGDVAFYILDPERYKDLSIRKKTKERLADLLRYLRALPEGGRVVIVGHSQGSVIATETEEAGGCGVLTIGSPIGALYHHFLGWDPRRAISLSDWTNLYHADDPIGGEILPGPPRHEPVPGRGHGGYLREKEVIRELIQLCKRPC